MFLQLKFLMNRMSHLPRQNFTSLVTLFDCGLQHQVLFLHLVIVVLEEHNLAIL